MPNRAFDWLRQAIKDLNHAEASRKNGDHEWACFAAHQAGEKAVKALHLYVGQEAWGHVIARLLKDLPFEHYGPLQSGEAIKYASEIVEFVRSQMAG